MSSSKLIPAGTPNDGLPENWAPVEETPFQVPSAPPAAPAGTGPMFAGSIPAAMQLTPDIMPTRYPGGIGGYRIMPPPPSGVAANNAATKSLIETVSETFINNPGGTIIALQTNGIPNASQDILDQIQGPGMLISSGGAGSVTFTASRLSSAVQFVTTDGNDSLDGLSWATAKQTIAPAITSLGVAGGTIYLGIGTFSASATLVLGAPITLQGNNQLSVITIANAANVDVLSITAPGCRITGCTIDGNAAGQSSAGTGITIAAQVSDTTIDGNLIQNTWAEGIFVNGGASFLAIYRNKFSLCNQLAANKFAIRFLEGSGQLDNTISISRNTFLQVGNGCIGFYVTQINGTGIADIVIYENSFQFGGGAYTSTAVAIFANTQTGVDSVVQETRISGNLILGGSVTGDQGVYVEGTAYGTNILGNTFQDTFGAAIWFNTPNTQTSQSSRSIVISGNDIDDFGQVRLSGSGFAAAAITGNSIQGETDGSTQTAITIEGVNSGTYTDVVVTGNIIQPFDFPGEAPLFLHNVANVTVSGNAIRGIGATSTVPAITLTSASNCSIVGNTITGFSGSGAGAIGIDITNSASTGNLIGPNSYSGVTTQVADSGTATDYGVRLVPTPALSSSAGFVGDVAKDATHWYVCIATNTWVRTTLATF